MVIVLIPLKSESPFGVYVTLKAETPAISG